MFFIILGKEEKKSKLVRSQSFSTQVLHPKYSNIDKCPKYLYNLHCLPHGQMFANRQLL